MRFWDASALVPLVVEEAGSDLCAGFLRDDPEMVIWGLTRLELASAIERRAREGLLRPTERSAAFRRGERIFAAAHEVSDLAAVRVRGVALLARHSLRVADAAQLGAALLVADPDPSSLAMVVLNRRLAEAAAQESLAVFTWPE